MTWRRPSTNFAPPVPPLRTQIKRASLFPFLGLFLLLLLFWPGPDHRRRRGVFLTRDPAGRVRQEENLGRRAKARRKENPFASVRRRSCSRCGQGFSGLM